MQSASPVSAGKELFVTSTTASSMSSSPNAYDAGLFTSEEQNANLFFGEQTANIAQLPAWLNLAAAAAAAAEPAVTNELNVNSSTTATPASAAALATTEAFPLSSGLLASHTWPAAQTSQKRKRTPSAAETAAAAAAAGHLMSASAALCTALPSGQAVSASISQPSSLADMRTTSASPVVFGDAMFIPATSESTEAPPVALGLGSILRAGVQPTQAGTTTTLLSSTQTSPEMPANKLHMTTVKREPSAEEIVNPFAAHTPPMTGASIDMQMANRGAVIMPTATNTTTATTTAAANAMALVAGLSPVFLQQRPLSPQESAILNTWPVSQTPAGSGMNMGVPALGMHTPVENGSPAQMPTNFIATNMAPMVHPVTTASPDMMTTVSLPANDQQSQPVIGSPISPHTLPKTILATAAPQPVCGMSPQLMNAMQMPNFQRSGPGRLALDQPNQPLTTSLPTPTDAAFEMTSGELTGMNHKRARRDTDTCCTASNTAELDTFSPIQSPQGQAMGPANMEHSGSQAMDDARPRRQRPRFPGDLYTPRWVRFSGQAKEGCCEDCRPAKWLQLKNSAYWYHKQFYHGISSVSGRPFIAPLETRVRDRDMVEGLCHQCNTWVPVASHRRRNCVLWYRHAHKCHVYQRPRMATAAQAATASVVASHTNNVHPTTAAPANSSVVQ